jgi:hypothetical protein
MSRMLTTMTLMLVVAACSREPAVSSGNSSAINAVQDDAGATTAAAPGPAVTNSGGATAPAAVGDVLADSQRGATAGSEEEGASGCAGEIGQAEAERLVRQCSDVSPASRPPCNTSNSCEVIREEINRGCAFLKEDAPAFCEDAG